MLVSIQYRVGICGFFSYDYNEKRLGNFGLYDQIFALEWVQENIINFGGDPNNVTIFGESAGSFSVDALQRSPLTKTLFHKAIAQSGTLLSTWCPQTNSNYKHTVSVFKKELNERVSTIQINYFLVVMNNKLLSIIYLLIFFENFNPYIFVQFFVLTNW